MDDEPQRIRTQAQALALDGDDKEAVALVSDGMGDHPESALLQVTLAELYELQGVPGGLVLATRAVQLAPRDPKILFLASRVVANDGELDRAREWMQRLHLQGVPDDFPFVNDVIFLSGRLMADAGELETGVRAMMAAFEQAPATPGWGVALAEALDAEGDRPGALIIVRRAQQAGAPDWEALAVLAERLGA